MDFNRTTTPLFIDPHTPIQAEAEALFDIILSPSFYWVKRIPLPVKSVREVTRLLPSLFEDTVPEGKYSYYAYKDQELYCIFAYDDKNILDILADKGIYPEQINRVYFAQSEFQDIEEAISIDDHCALDLEERVVVKLPDTLVEQSKPLELKEHQFSEHSIELARYAHIATTKSLINFSLFMGALIMIFALDWIVSSTKISEFDTAPSHLFQEHNLPMTRVQNEAILSSLQKQYHKQMELRRLSAEILNLKLNKKEYITLYDLKGKKLTVELQIPSAKRVTAILKQLHKNHPSMKEKYQNSLLRLEFEL